jgi:signal transduction histidine kinase/ActR/RegA family two-component response regulator
MQRNLFRSVEDSAHEVPEESHAQQRGQGDGGEPVLYADALYADALERLLSASLSSEGLSQLLSRLLKIFASIAGAEVAFGLLRDGAALQSRASLGVEAKEKIEFSLSGEEALEGRPLSAQMPGFAVRDPGRIAHEPKLAQAFCVPLVHADGLVGVIYLGMLETLPRAVGNPELLARLAGPSATALARQASREQLERDVRARDDVLGVVAHDLQNPLNVISMAANMLLQRVPDQAARRPIERIVRSVQRATRLLRDLLDIGAIEEGHFAVECRRLDAAALILSALESQQSLAADASVITATDLSPELPPIDADEERLLEVLENLIGNAIKFTSPGGTISVGATREDEEIKIWVTDNGSGIPAQQLPHIFDRFWQAKRADRRGTGLGLTICKGIVEAHQGRIWAESVEGKGTTVFFTLPAVASPDSRHVVTNVANILLVDDRPENLMALKSILDRPDYRLVTADSGDKALRVALREQFAVALIDIAMPGMNGLEVATHLKELERSRDIPIIFVTAFGDDPQEIHRAYAAGGADYLVKPLDAEIVKKKVAVFVDLSRRRRQSDRPPPEAAARG